MTHEEKITYFKMAASFNNIGFTEYQVDVLISMYDMILEKKGKTSIEDMVDIQFWAKGREIDREAEKERLKDEKLEAIKKEE